ncbi:uncharacterized protein AC631_03144 [Debaryomyces fabryi]|uniref:Trafficking protein particle complex subunit 11 domain-containing protein n=1 Tax=Debaryomyces fabryi TaxID=58627 RepID=A0A0V1PXT8_9ASCO|nr:uncharacterized protein AC631_03144 [Debaryomyces fabryi]KSA01076.1 hypothetical protein AC631_03144 [Debaryomyces fabryi]CUM48925.1 unnamed protein product [Debaryomyces fabryi]
MENYNSLFLQQLVPLLFFQTEGSSEVVLKLIKTLDQFNIKDAIWDNSIIKNRLLNIKYRIKVIETLEYQLPQGIKSSTEEDEHSILSPFNMKSELFPNGILSYKWFKKYIEDIPFASIMTFSLGQTSESDNELIDRINSFKNAYQESRVSLVVIIISDSEDINADDDRIHNLRQATGLPKLTGLIYLNTCPDTIGRDIEILVSSVLSNLKAVAVDFYSSIENKVRQRHKKYYSCPSTSSIDTKIELTPIFLETRNLIKQGMLNQLSHPHNLETSLKFLEYAYQDIIELSRDNFTNIIKEDSISRHDLELYDQFRTLIDVIAFHIVRGYLSLEEPILALKKHKAHIINVLDAFNGGNGDNNNWISIQYQWLGELMTLIPGSILNSLNLKGYKKKSKNSKVFKIFGGVQFYETHDYDLITSPEFVFMKSAEYCTGTSGKNIKLKYLNNSDDLETVSKRKIMLLLNAKDCLQKDDSHKSSSDGHSNFGSMCQYISWLIANEYSKLSDEASLSKAIEYYELCLSEAQFGNARISQIILQNLLKYYSKSKNIRKMLATVLKLSGLSFPGGNVPIQINLNDLGSKESDLHELDTNDIQLVDVDALLLSEQYNKLGPNECSLYESCVSQITFKPLINLQHLKMILSEGSDEAQVRLSIKKCEVKFHKQGEHSDPCAYKDVVITQNSTLPSDFLQTVEVLEKGNKFGGEFNISFTDSDDRNASKVFQFSQVSRRAGSYMIGSINLETEISISNSGKELKLTGKNSIALDDGNSANVSHHKFMYSTTKESRLQKTAVRMYSQAPHVIRVLPLKPDVTITMESSVVNSIIVGEKISIPFRIQYKSPKNQKVAYKNILLAPKVKIISDAQDQGFVSPLTTQVNWDELKDDEPLSLKSLVSSDEETTTHNLNISILNSSINGDDNSSILNNTFMASIDLKTLVSEEGEDNSEENSLTIYDTADYTLPVITRPFDCKFSISPRYRNEDAVDMPCPFILSPDSKDSNSRDKTSNYSMPIATRLWMGKLSLVDNLAQSNKESELQIEEAKFSIKSKNSELIVETIDQEHRINQNDITQLFTTRSKNGFSHRNVMVNASVNIKWKRKDKEIINEFKSIEWQIVLPLSDPRVLLSLEFKETKMAKFKYIIENPTPRIFMFTTQLSTEEINDDIEWQFEDDRNIVPLKQPAFPVLPFNRNIIEFYAKLTNNTSQDLIALPQFKVYDVHYKVTLPTLAVCENVVVKNNNSLYWQLNGQPTALSLR